MGATTLEQFCDELGKRQRDAEHLAAHVRTLAFLATTVDGGPPDLALLVEDLAASYKRLALAVCGLRGKLVAPAVYAAPRPELVVERLPPWFCRLCGAPAEQYATGPDPKYLCTGCGCDDSLCICRPSGVAANDSNPDSGGEPPPGGQHADTADELAAHGTFTVCQVEPPPRLRLVRPEALTGFQPRATGLEAAGWADFSWEAGVGFRCEKPGRGAVTAHTMGELVERCAERDVEFDWLAAELPALRFRFCQWDARMGWLVQDLDDASGVTHFHDMDAAVLLAKCRTVRGIAQMFEQLAAGVH